jgi:putative tricarboxylic transport membrane protein
LALALIAFSVIVIREANRLPPPFFDPLGSAAVPRFVAGLLILLGLAVVGRCLLTPVVRKKDVTADTRSPWVALGALAVSVVYVALMQTDLLGFAPASSLFVIGLGIILSRGDKKVILWMLPMGIIVGYGLNYLLTEIFYIDLPQRSFFDGGD